MKKLIPISILIISFIAIWAFSPSQPPEATQSEEKENTLGKEVTDDRGFALVELFTSQGCSSCPPADRLLSELAKNNDAVIALSFHVDYWNYLGWKDPFSQKQFTDRQYRYAKLLNSQVYTPQMVVNGKTEFVGSQKANALHFTKKAIANSPKVKVNADAVAKNRIIHINYELSQSEENQMLNVALVQKKATIQVKRGENGGRTLHHSNVVRGFRSIKLAKDISGKTTLDLPEGLDKENCFIVVFAQQESSWEILGAKKVKL